EFTLLSHQGKAQAKVVHVSGGEVKNVTGIEMIGDDIALIKSETIRNHDAESAEIIKEKLKIDVWKFVEKKNPDYKKDVIKHQTLVSLLIEFTEKREEELKANFDYYIEGKDLEIKTLGERCNQLLKDKGDLIDKCKSLEEENNKLLDVISNYEVKVADLDQQIEREKNLNQVLSDHNEQLRELIEKMKADVKQGQSYWNSGEMQYGLYQRLLDKWEIKEK
ncbi:MAG: hypothetical protein J6T31_05915, partial [Methanobrevibacter sp.]|nr:hypothetical protein [Methanobrevibacter sp.]